MEKIRVETGKRYKSIMPHSEVCIHMRVADKVMEFEKLERRAVQLFEDGKPFSHPIFPGEAGVMEDEEGFYFNSNGWDQV